MAFTINGIKIKTIADPQNAIANMTLDKIRSKFLEIDAIKSLDAKFKRQSNEELLNQREEVKYFGGSMFEEDSKEEEPIESEFQPVKDVKTVIIKLQTLPISIPPSF